MKRLLLGVTLMVAALGASAQGFYVGAHGGVSQAKSACDDFSGPGISCDDKDVMWRILGGYQINKNFAVEAAYTDLGEAKATGPGGFVSAKSHALELVAVGIVPIDRFSLYGKLGVYHGTTDGQARTVLVRGDASDTATELTYGVGAGFDVTRQVTLRAEYQKYNDFGGDNVGKSDIDVFSLGVLFRF